MHKTIYIKATKKNRFIERFKIKLNTNIIINNVYEQNKYKKLKQRHFS